MAVECRIENLKSEIHTSEGMQYLNIAIVPPLQKKNSYLAAEARIKKNFENCAKIDTITQNIALKAISTNISS